MISVSHINKLFGKLKVIEDLSFEVKPGQVLGLLGPNGAGKTTTLRCLAGILTPDNGEITLNSINLRNNAVEAKRSLAFLPDQPDFFETLTVYEHIRFIAQLYEMKNYEDKANDYLKRFELEHKKHSLTSELSRGMKQRLGLICTFLHEPKVILLDEPITALDPKGVRIFNEAILEHARNGASILVSSHQLALLQHCSTHIMVMNQGKIFYFDSLEKIKSEMKNVNETVFLEELFFKLTENK